MKDAKIQIEFTTHCLANSSANDGKKDCFPRDTTTNDIIFQQSWWYSAFTKAIEISKTKGIKPSDVCIDLMIKAETDLYKRKYGENNFRVHEAIFPGSSITINAIVADHITESTLTAILTKMGTYIGLSPYGHKLGYGKFKLIKVTIEPSVEG
ncbi:hypothetical protein ACFLQL_00385 [Verrucomicrobiota bacterium]